MHDKISWQDHTKDSAAAIRAQPYRREASTAWQVSGFRMAPRSSSMGRRFENYFSALLDTSQRIVGAYRSVLRGTRQARYSGRGSGLARKRTRKQRDQ